MGTGRETSASRSTAGERRRRKLAAGPVALFLVTLLAGLLVSCSTTVAAQAGAMWTQQTTPPHGRPSGVLLADSCVNPSACSTVGYSINASGDYETLAENWDGSTWVVQTTGTPAGATGSQLDGVSCSSPTACTAVGNYTDASGATHGLAETLLGTTWTIQALKDPASATSSTLDGVSCAGDGCMAVGSYQLSSGVDKTLADWWNGGAWSVQTTAQPAGAEASQLDGVSCTSGTTCAAVGSLTKPSTEKKGGSSTSTLAESWNGTAWAIESTPTPPGGTAPIDELTGVSCTSAVACIAVGYRTNKDESYLTLAEAWNGSMWSLQSGAEPTHATSSGLDAVSCSTSATCIAVGSFENTKGLTKTLAESWNGTSWVVDARPASQTTDPNVLDAISCPSSIVCRAVGYDTQPIADDVSLAEAWNGTSWSIQTTPNPAGDPDNQLDGVSCPSANACTAIGSGANTTRGDLTLAESWNGTTWKSQTTENPAGATAAQLVGISCTSATACTAVGEYTNTSGANRALAESLVGSTWTTEAIPVPSGAAGTSLAGVSCSGNTCVAVGSYQDSSGVTHGLAGFWAGNGWSVQANPEPAGAVSSQLDSVSCPTASWCIATGAYTGPSGITAPLSASWDGTTWDVQTPPAPAAALTSGLEGVSCTAVASCTAVGDYAFYGTESKPVIQSSGLAESWNGTAWTLETTPTPAGASGSELAGVFCTPQFGCTAVGDYTNASGVTHALAESAAGATWNIQPVPSPSGASDRAADRDFLPCRHLHRRGRILR